MTLDSLNTCFLGGRVGFIFRSFFPFVFRYRFYLKIAPFWLRFGSQSDLKSHFFGVFWRVGFRTRFLTVKSMNIMVSSRQEHDFQGSPGSNKWSKMSSKIVKNHEETLQKTSCFLTLIFRWFLKDFGAQMPPKMSPKTQKFAPNLLLLLSKALWGPRGGPFHWFQVIWTGFKLDFGRFGERFCYEFIVPGRFSARLLWTIAGLITAVTSNLH